MLHLVPSPAIQHAHMFDKRLGTGTSRTQPDSIFLLIYSFVSFSLFPPLFSFSFSFSLIFSPNLLRPAVQLRDNLRLQVRGKKYWKKMETKRAEMFQGLDLDQILFAKKRQKKEEERIAQVKRLEERKIKEKKLKNIKKKKKSRRI